MELTPEEKKVFKKMGKKSAKSRFFGMTKEEISQRMSDVRKKGIANSETNSASK